MTSTKPRKRRFSGFNYKQACKQLNLTEVTVWDLKTESVPASDFFQERLQRLQYFDLQSYEKSKKLLIDAICEEAIQGFDQLKIWKGASLESDVLWRNVDYLIADPNATIGPAYGQVRLSINGSIH